MAAACASNFRSTLQRDLLFRLQSKNVAVDSVDVVKHTTFPVLRLVNRKQRFMAVCMSYMPYDLPQYHGVNGGRSAGGGDICEGGGDDAFGPILNFEEVMKETKARGVNLPPDMFEAAKSTGIPKLFLLRYLSMQGLGWGLGFAMRSSSMFRNQMMIDPSYVKQHGFKFQFDVFVDLIAVIAMKMLGRTYKEAVSYLLIRLFAKILNIGFRAPFDSRTRQQRTSEFNSMFEVKRSELFTRIAYCCAATIFTGLMVVFYGKTI